MKPRVIKGVLHNFLGTYTSRSSDYDGYWLFGMLGDDIDELNVDLLNPPVAGMQSPLVMAAIKIAAEKFREQMEKAGLSVSCAQEARLAITVLPELRQGAVNGHVKTGHDVRFVATARLNSGKKCGCEMTIFIAPHDRRVELRSNRTVSKLVLNQANLIGRGAFSWVITGTENGCVYKIFKRHTHPDYTGEDPFDDERNSAVFRAELDAYKIIERHEDLRIHAPDFLGAVQVKGVVDTNGCDISDGFLLDCCLCIERVLGEAQKLNQLVEVHDHLKRFETSLKAVGVKYTLDSSVFSPGDKDRFKVIDFAVSDAANDYDVARALG
jgi:hypothetical protein